MYAMVGNHCEYELLAFIMAPTVPTNVRLRRSNKEDGYVHEKIRK